jgi:hypothetical protein
MVMMAASDNLRRPGERRDPYGAELLFGAGANAFLEDSRQGLWVAAFAGTT